MRRISFTSIVLVVLSVNLISCKKEVEEPMEQTTATTEYSIEFVIGDYSGENNYTNLDLYVDNQLKGNLSNYMVNINEESIGVELEATGTFPSALSVPVNLNQTYNIEFRDAVNDSLVANITGFVKLTPNDFDGSNSPALWYSQSVENISMNWNTSYIDNTIGTNGYNYYFMPFGDKMIFEINFSQ
ncbi:MAG: hypothetical protein HWE22_13965 [Flavobacteriales bacterium]|nr:hypothetical protein [Flavobacteriales bacterium]